MIVRKEIKINNCTLSYIENNSGCNTILFFIHGNSGAATMWHPQLESDQLSSYHLIAIDLPAHGYSDLLDSRSYRVSFLSSLIAAAVIELAQYKKFVLIGFSMGANIITEMPLESLQPKGIVLLSPTIWGGEIVSSNLRNQASVIPLFRDTAHKNEVMRFFQEACFFDNPKVISDLTYSYYQVRSPFRSAIVKATEEERVDEIALLKKYEKNLLVVFGNNDQLLNPAYLDSAGLLLWKNTILKIHEAGHFLSFDQSKIVNGLIYEYVEDCLI